MCDGSLRGALGLLRWHLLHTLAFLAVTFLAPAPARADHGGPLRDAPMSPLMVGLLSGGLALLAIALIAVIAVAFSRRARSSDEGRS
jgi:hypothetical protein